jgi:hypothetical protein
VEGDLNRNSNKPRGYGLARHPVNDGGPGDPSNVYALDVGAWLSPCYKNMPGKRPAFFLNGGLII